MFFCKCNNKCVQYFLSYVIIIVEKGGEQCGRNQQPEDLSTNGNKKVDDEAAQPGRAPPSPASPAHSPGAKYHHQRSPSPSSIIDPVRPDVIPKSAVMNAVSAGAPLDLSSHFPFLLAGGGNPFNMLHGGGGGLPGNAMLSHLAKTAGLGGGGVADLHNMGLILPPNSLGLSGNCSIVIDPDPIL